MTPATEKKKMAEHASPAALPGTAAPLWCGDGFCYLNPTYFTEGRALSSWQQLFCCFRSVKWRGTSPQIPVRFVVPASGLFRHTAAVALVTSRWSLKRSLLYLL